ncbi:hypothetical protein GLYMA_04G122300v4 [Glycine max]|uniref:Uncharacterized protein n=2 Tax=Glycine subgen. Soja TaxID=1462606 RepID=A0A0R0KEH1_SOYBN|nr:hypothetical protein JHK87_009697 [Glycine soja]KAG5066105.1 hypothetical protein JHK86_009836 [Glycine max]KAH1111037.1 hypothetical protein GYH30_009706 [Glycine max]KRH62659.1 hypothetical protein GLYMA_04G122300v4 [Glycine max]RZC16227.1 hypothetical protein D0Y65_009487 [Glycine soja]
MALLSGSRDLFSLFGCPSEPATCLPSHVLKIYVLFGAIFKDLCPLIYYYKYLL